MGAAIRAYPWNESALGEPAGWPESLKTAIRIMLTSRQPIWIGWGSALIFFYNDAYRSIAGGKHPEALGQPTATVWREIWDDIAPLLATAMSGEEGTYVEEQLLIMERSGYPEETYYTFSYSPIPDAHGGAGGIICANSEDTRRVIGERQLTLLRDLSARMVKPQSWQDVAARAMEVIGGNPQDLPFALLFAVPPAPAAIELLGTCGMAAAHGAAQPASWPLREVLTGLELTLINLPPESALPSGAWPRAPGRAVLARLTLPGAEGIQLVLAAGLNPFRQFDDSYRNFIESLVQQIEIAIASVRALEEERRRAEALTELDRAKSTFFANISHEFRTPLTLMLGPIEDALSEARDVVMINRGTAELIHRNGLRLQKLVNNLLDFSRIEAGRVQTQRVPVDLAALTADIASGFRSLVERAGLSFRVDCAALPRIIAVDTEMWEKIVLNLLSNAYKFTHSGQIELRLEAVPEGARLTVSDTGIGVPDEEIPHLFTRFHRVAGAKGRSIEGSGIGLALVQELVRLHGGHIAVSSRLGAGTRFTVTIPAGPEADDTTPGALPVPRSQYGNYVEEAARWQALEPPAPGPAAPKTGGGRILIADDNADLRLYMQRMLSAQGYAVELAVDGAAALAATRRESFDLVISDVMMPVMDGIDLLRALRADTGLCELPVILLSAQAGEEARVSGFQAGADDYLTKPFSARDLLARVSSTLQLAALRRETAERLRALNETLENRMAEAAADLDRLWELSEDLLAVTDAAGKLLRVSPSWERQLGHPRQGLLARRMTALFHPDDAEALQPRLTAALQNRAPAHFESRMGTSAGCWRLIDWTFSPDPVHARLHGVGRDITEDRARATALTQAEAALHAAQKMEAIGKLTGGVAHDFNNLLQVIGGNLQLLAKDVAGSERAETRLRNALGGVSRGAKLASQLLSFGRRQPLAPKIVNLGRFVRGLDDMLRRALGDGIEIETIVSGGLWNSFVDPFQVENALLNLAINARDAMEGHGKLTIEAGNALLDEEYSLRHSDVTPGQYVVVAVTDTGCGMTPEVIEQVFEPFFSTKPEGQGTGLGLSMVYGFVKQSEGHIKIYSEPGHGTTVRIYLPRVRQDEDVVTETESGPVIGGSETILVVEDDEQVRGTVVELLADLGYHVLKAKDAEAALAIVESGVPIDLLFSDVVMPGPVRSRDLARRAQERLPGIAVLFTSGYTENSIVHAGRLDEGIELLSKPYTREALARRVRALLQNAQPAAERQSTQPAAARPPAPLRALRVLLVEDEELIRMITAENLKDLGHQVFIAPTVEEALALLRQMAMDVLLTDINLPGRSGIDLASAARRQQPGLRIIFTSGYYAGAELKQKSGLSDIIYLLKPYTRESLAKAIADATK